MGNKNGSTPPKGNTKVESYGAHSLGWMASFVRWISRQDTDLKLTNFRFRGPVTQSSSNEVMLHVVDFIVRALTVVHEEFDLVLWIEVLLMNCRLKIYMTSCTFSCLWLSPSICLFVDDGFNSLDSWHCPFSKTAWSNVQGNVPWLFLITRL